MTSLFLEVLSTSEAVYTKNDELLAQTDPARAIKQACALINNVSTAFVLVRRISISDIPGDGRTTEKRHVCSAYSMRRTILETVISEQQ